MIAEKIKQLRKSKKISQKQLAAAVFVSPSAISQYESGRTTPNRENLARLAEYFNVSTAYLEGKSPNPELEELMNMEYHDGISIRSLVSKCRSVNKENRHALMLIIDALSKNKI